MCMISPETLKPYCSGGFWMLTTFRSQNFHSGGCSAEGFAVTFYLLNEVDVHAMSLKAKAQTQVLPIVILRALPSMIFTHLSGLQLFPTPHTFVGTRWHLTIILFAYVQHSCVPYTPHVHSSCDLERARDVHIDATSTVHPQLPWSSLTALQDPCNGWGTSPETVRQN